jgi:hypothetical protein
VFSSPSVFRHNEAIEDFTGDKSIITILVTIHVDFVHKSWIDIISKIDLSVIIDIHVFEEVFGFIDDISTIPRSNATWWFDITVTVDVSKFWAVFISPFIFNNNNTSVNFTIIDSSIIVKVTVFN